jgi:hypothetical protein
MFCKMQNVQSNIHNLILDPSKNILNTFYFLFKNQKIFLRHKEINHRASTNQNNQIEIF